jgi:NitT/TauT family transport system permease protein
MTQTRIARLIYPLVGLAVIIVIWQAYADLFRISRIVLPSPSDILYASWRNFGLLLQETWPTFLESVCGFVLALVIGIPMAVCVANSRLLNLSLYPILIATQSVPIVVDTATGLQETPPGLIELGRSLRASAWQMFWKVQLPAALPFIFSGAKVAVTLAVIGAVIGEFVGSVNGLGNLLLSANAQLNGPLAWAALVWLSVLGILLFIAVVAAQRLIMPWADAGH